MTRIWKAIQCLILEVKGQCLYTRVYGEVRRMGGVRWSGSGKEGDYRKRGNTWRTWIGIGKSDCVYLWHPAGVSHVYIYNIYQLKQSNVDIHSQSIPYIQENCSLRDAKLNHQTLGTMQSSVCYCRLKGTSALCCGHRVAACAWLQDSPGSNSVGILRLGERRKGQMI